MEENYFVHERFYYRNQECYHIYKNGNDFLFSTNNKKYAIKRCKRLAKKGDYIELWHYYNEEKRHLEEYWN